MAPTEPRPLRYTATLVAIGAIAGILSGLFGVGGGIIIVPALVLLLGIEQRRATGTSLLAVVPISIAAAAFYVANGAIDWRVAGLLAVGIVIGGQIGSLLLAKLPQRTLRWIFIAFMLAVAVRMLLAMPESIDGALDMDAWHIILLPLIGVAFGVLAGLLGVGGGVFIVPALILGFGVGELDARGTSLVAIIPGGITSTISNLRRKNVLLREGLTVGLVGAAFTFAGGALAFLIPAGVGNILFGILLAALAIRLIVSDLRAKRKNR
ncbi:sulfite exporter TauE/SafE family protein [Salinibacterium hongtaonis]|uniref:sulfite exporter TauE/SafE family protein n=1 Tax=Homoserinimonas hongtaonis TaxID=2079791 RepID=UPI000D369D9A|nr:sulfite exporter TauE/SafE family protein [Salinibacterium hongtaonis]AWB88622.1 sulfite exporter TauE/SafE family protein [Salinibacterium hongtaonis]